MLLLAIGYTLLGVVLPTPLLTSAGLQFGHALAWTLFHTLGLGLLLKAQSARKFIVRHFLKHYHYPARDVGRSAVREAFASWKAVYNLSMCMSYGDYSQVSLFQKSGLIRGGSVLLWGGVEDIRAAARLDHG